MFNAKMTQASTVCVKRYSWSKITLTGSLEVQSLVPRAFRVEMHKAQFGKTTEASSVVPYGIITLKMTMDLYVWYGLITDFFFSKNQSFLKVS